LDSASLNINIHLLYFDVMLINCGCSYQMRIIGREFNFLVHHVSFSNIILENYIVFYNILINFSINYFVFISIS